MTILYVTIAVLGVFAAKSIFDVRRLAKRYTELLSRAPSNKNSTPTP
jgi:hypothetical protein